MQITDVRLRRVSSEGRMKAIASITIDNEFVVHDIRVIDGNNGMFVAMPSKRTPDGELSYGGTFGREGNKYWTDA